MLGGMGSPLGAVPGGLLAWLDRRMGLDLAWQPEVDGVMYSDRPGSILLRDMQRRGAGAVK
ncbi:MAG: hypothetical protein WAN86_27415, partial [Hyphomicrobiaceae bacterium]